MTSLRSALTARIETVAALTCVTRQRPLMNSALLIRDTLRSASDEELAAVAPQLTRAIDMAGKFVAYAGGMQ